MRDRRVVPRTCRDRPRLLSTLAAAALAWPGCAPGSGGAAEDAPEPARSQPDPLYQDFREAKLDAAGHPHGAHVLEAETACAPEVGRADGSSVRAEPGRDEAGAICDASTERLGRGPWIVTVRALVESMPPRACGADAGCAPASAPFELRAYDADGEVLGERRFTGEHFETLLEYANAPLRFSLGDAGPVRIEVRWGGEVGVRLDYVEVFRPSRRLVIGPASGVLAPDARLRLEAIGFTGGEPLPSLKLRCNGEDRSGRLRRMLDAGEATVEQTEFRRIVEAPAAPLLEGCEAPRRVAVDVSDDSYRDATSEVLYWSEPPPCDYEGEGDARVLVTGFVPFPAGSRTVNSSEVAVEATDPASIPDARLMRPVLPVEYDSAPAIVRDAIRRCEPDVVVGFGQGRGEIDVERTAYNRKDTSEVAGGVPDNRGIIHDGAAIVEDGPAELRTELDVGATVEALEAADIDAGPSDDPGRYVCNDLFYEIVTETGNDDVIGGFVHLPRVFSPTEEDRDELGTTVATVVRQALLSRERPRGAR